MKKSNLIFPSFLALALLAGCGGGTDASSQPAISSSDSDFSSLASSLDSSNNETSSSNFESSSESKPSSSSESSSSVEVKQDGSRQYPFLISSSADLEEYFLKENEKVGQNVYFSVTNDIEYTGEWKTSYQTNAFSGIVLGNNHTISGIKIASGYTSKQCYSFIGNAKDAYFYDLNLDMQIDLFLSGKSKTYLVGGLTSISTNVVYNNVKVSYSNFDLSLATNGDSTIYVGGLTPYWSSEAPETQSGICYYSMEYVSVEGDILVDASESSDTAVITGGLLGALYNSYYDATDVFGINNCKYEGNITAGDAVGGICGVLMSYASILNSYVKAGKLEAANASPSYVGGIVGQGNYFQSLVGNYADVDRIIGTKGTNSYKSFAGDIVGYAPASEKVYGYEGTLNYNNYAKGADITIAENKRVSENKANYSASLLTDTLKFPANVWDLSGNKPSFKSNISLGKISVSVDANGGVGNFGVVQSIQGQVSGEVATLSANYKSYLQLRENYASTGLYYDQDCKYEYRWYTPFNVSSTLYVGWADLTPILGTYKLTCKYYEYTYDSGNLVVTNQYIYWVMKDGAYSQYEYEFDGTYISLLDYISPLPNSVDARLAKNFSQTYGGYSDSVITLNDNGTLEFYDTTSDDAVYTGVKTADIQIPSLENSPILGQWYTATSSNTLDIYISSNCAIVANYNDDTSKVHYFGGISLTGSKYTMGVGQRGLTADTYSYDAENNLMIGSKFVFAREKVNGIYGTSDNALRVVLTSSKNIVVKDNKVINATVSGEFKDGGIVVIDEIQYKISGKVLTLYEEVSPLVGTYTGKATGTRNTITAKMEVKNNKTGVLTLESSVLNFAWSFNETTNKFLMTFKNGQNVGDWDLDEQFTLSYDSDLKKLSGNITMSYGDYSFLLEVAVGGLGGSTEEEVTDPEPVDTGVIGTYSGTLTVVSSFAVTVNVNGDGTLVISWGSSAINFTYSYNESTRKLAVKLVSQTGTQGFYDEGDYEFTYNDGSITGTFSADYSYDCRLNVSK